MLHNIYTYIQTIHLDEKKKTKHKWRKVFFCLFMSHMWNIIYKYQCCIYGRYFDIYTHSIYKHQYGLSKRVYMYVYTIKKATSFLCLLWLNFSLNIPAPLRLRTNTLSIFQSHIYIYIK